MSKSFADHPETILKISEEFLEINELLVRIAMVQFLVEDCDDCLKCKCEWFEYGNYLVEKFKHLSFQLQNK